MTNVEFVIAIRLMMIVLALMVTSAQSSSLFRNDSSFVRAACSGSATLEYTKPAMSAAWVAMFDRSLRM